MNYFIECEILSCPKHVEAKKLANKYWTKLCNLDNKTAGLVLDNKDASTLTTKFDKIHEEFKGVIRGLKRCCHV